MKKNTNLISFDTEFFKRRGVKPKLREPPPKPERVKVDPKQDLVVGLAMDLLSIISPYTDSNPVGVIAALQVVANTIAAEYLKKLGAEMLGKVLAAAHVISNQYKAEYKNGTSTRSTDAGTQGTEAGQVDANHKDESER